MSVESLVFYKAVNNTDTAANGGRIGRVPIISGAQLNLFDYVSAMDLLAGRYPGGPKEPVYRKFGAKNEKSGSPPETALNAMAFFMSPTNGGDRKTMALGTETDVQSELSADLKLWVGAGKLNSSLSGGESQLELEMEGDEAEFVPGGYLYLSDQFKAGQTLASDVKVGDSVSYADGTWSKATYSSDLVYPKGRYLGNDLVMTYETGVSNEQKIPLPENKTTDESIGTGTGAVQPTLSALSGITNGLLIKSDFMPTITATCSGVSQTITFDSDGNCEGHCTGGQINPATGAWTTQPTWVSAPDNGTDITITYWDKCWSYSGNICTIDLDGQVATAFSATNTYASGALQGGDLVASYDGFNDTSAGGIYDETSYPIELVNDGVEEDAYELTFSSSSTFQVTGVNGGSLGTFNVSSDCAPVNPASGEPLFTVDHLGWIGSPTAGDKLQFSTHLGAMYIWVRQIVPAGTESEENNITPIRVTNE